MKHFPSEFVFESETTLKVVYTGEQTNPTPYFYAPSIEELLGSTNPAASASSRMKSLEARITNYNEQNDVVFEQYSVQLLGSSKPAWMHLSDGLYSILAVKTSNSLRARTMYYYNQACMFYIVNTAKTDVANVIQHWVNGVVLPTIVKNGEYVAHRKDGIGMRRGLTDAIKLAITCNELTDKAYMSITDAVYYIRFGLHTQTLRDYLKLKDGENIREHLEQDDLDALAKIESSIMGGIILGMPLNDILSSERLVKLYRRPLL